MKDGRAVILIWNSLQSKGLQESTKLKILNYLRSIKDREATEKRAEELIHIIDDPKNTEADILSILEKMEKSLKASETEAK